VKILPTGSSTSAPFMSLASMSYKRHWVMHASMQLLQISNVHPVSGSRGLAVCFDKRHVRGVVEDVNT
jgi:hypothetical protein